MMISGNLVKMKVEAGNPVDYNLILGDQNLRLNEYLGKKISLSFNGQINCIACGKLIPKSFAQGYCYPCMLSSPMNSECIIRPELCRAHLGKGRDPEWEERNHLQDHSVYLALSSAVKVGVTRNTQIPTRWIDQGASAAIRFATVPNRFLAGLIEVELKKHITDKTVWQKMLKNQVDNEANLAEEKKKLSGVLNDELKAYVSDDNTVTHFDYPVLDYPEKVKSISFDKESIFEGELIGIKGQYVMLADNRVLNIRRHTGYYINFRD
ncbi:MAG: DUF2797 domain-containing protein [Vicingaceae bacterium]